MRSLLVAVLVSVTACGVADTMVPRLNLKFEPAQLTLTGVRIADGRMTCEIEATIQAHGGSPGNTLLLTGITSTFFDAAGTRINSVAGVPQEWFATNRLKYDERAVAHRTANGPAGPMSIQIALAYDDPGGVGHTETLAVSCQ